MGLVVSDFFIKRKMWNQSTGTGFAASSIAIDESEMSPSGLSGNALAKLVRRPVA